MGNMPNCISGISVKSLKNKLDLIAIFTNSYQTKKSNREIWFWFFFLAFKYMYILIIGTSTIFHMFFMYHINKCIFKKFLKIKIYFIESIKNKKNLMKK